MTQDNKPGEDADDPDEERPYPRHGAIHEDANQRHYAREQPIESKEGNENDDRRAGISQEHKTQKYPRDALKQEEPPDIRLLG